MAQRQFKSDDTSKWQDKYGNGSAGAYSTSDHLGDSARTGYSNTTFAGTEGNSTGTAGAVGNFVAGDLILIHQSRNGGDGAGVWELNKIVNTGAGTNWTLTYPLTKDYATTGQVYRLLQYSSITLGHTLSGVAFNGTVGGVVALLCNGTITVNGAITASSRGYRGRAGTNRATLNSSAAGQGEGTSGAAGTASTAANGNGGGGGGGGGDGGAGGGGGGHSTAGANGGAGQGTAGTGGAAYGQQALTHLAMGGGGGGGKGESNCSASGTGGGTGATGGGVILLIGKTITGTGAIGCSALSAGGAGHNCGHEGSGGGGGASGGSILFKGQTIDLSSITATAVLSAGGAAGGAASGAGGTGRAGRIHADYSTSISGTTNPSIDSTQDLTLADIPGGNPMFFGVGGTLG